MNIETTETGSFFASDPQRPGAWAEAATEQAARTELAQVATEWDALNPATTLNSHNRDSH